ncbi:DNA mismatch repair protein MutS [Aureimonas flava]|uniref:DNA mismatch repair protein MutS n=1 Tax=Aureimonas flava TaxID=2320271 RepID=A0A3A1WPU0_9HYPH|nr:Smr/MutS family protein [Aureimonas flava]RIY02763.1 DNA mismatch repair protein MutS [Aureimonas flava]
MRRRRDLSGEERRLWASVARSAVPLPGRTTPDLPPEPEPPAPAPAAGATPPRPNGMAAALVPATRRPAAPPALQPIDRPVRRKIGKGRIELEDRIDLHGWSEAVAHGALLHFLRGAKARGLRHVLVITGRGASFGSTGSLRRALPHWFATPDFRVLVSGYDQAERGHGGDGAFYVRVRRR